MFSPNGKALMMCYFDALRQSTFLLKRFASGEGIYSLVICITYSVTEFVAPDSYYRRLFQQLRYVPFSSLCVKTYWYEKCFLLPYVQFKG